MLNISNHQENINQIPLIRGYEEREIENIWEILFHGNRAAVWDDEKVLEMNSGDGYTAM